MARGGKVVVPRSLAKHAISKVGMVEVVKQVVAQAAPLADRAFLERMLDAGRAAKASGVDMRTIENQAKVVEQATRDKALETRAASSRMGNFDEAAVLAEARAPGSQVLLPMKASGKWNMDGAGSNEIGGELTQEVCARELKARGVAVKRNNPGTKHAGEVHASETLVILMKRLKGHCGTRSVIKLTDDYGDLKSARRGWSERLPPGARPAVIDMTDLALSPPPWGGAPMDEG